jgi:hypothetical protein
MGRTGTQIANSLLGKSGAEREALLWGALSAGEIPDRLEGAEFLPVDIREKDKNGKMRDLRILVSPRHVEVGTDEDPFFAPLWPEASQRYANMRGSILPSRKLVDAIWNASSKRLPIGPPPGFKIPGPDMADSRSWIAHNAVLQSRLGSTEQLVSGGKKDTVVGPTLDGTRVAIYSTPFSGSGALRAYTADKIPLHQPYSTIHHAQYSDYAHGTRLVAKNATLDGEPVSLMDLFQDPVLHVLVSDQGAFKPTFPNAGRGSAGKPVGVIVQPTRFVTAGSARLQFTAAGGVLGLLAGMAIALPFPLLAGAGAAGAVIGNLIARRR